jgi:hypothetical protein
MLLKPMAQKMGMTVNHTPKCHCELKGEGIEYSTVFVWLPVSGLPLGRVIWVLRMPAMFLPALFCIVQSYILGDGRWQMARHYITHLNSQCYFLSQIS